MSEKRGLALYSDPIESYIDAVDPEGATVRVYVKMSMPAGAFLEFSVKEPKLSDNGYVNISPLVQDKYERFLLEYGAGRSDDTLVSLTDEK